MQGAAAHADLLGGQRAVAVGFLQGANDQLFLRFLHRQIALRQHARRDRRRPRPPPRTVARQVARAKCARPGTAPPRARWPCAARARCPASGSSSRASSASAVKSFTGLSFSSANSRRKLCASSGMSSGRSRSGGRLISTTRSRKNRSSRNVPGLDQFLQVLVRGGDQPHVGGQGLVRADALEGALAQKAQQLDLDAWRQSRRSRPGTACRPAPARTARCAARARR